MKKHILSLTLSTFVFLGTDITFARDLKMLDTPCQRMINRNAYIAAQERSYNFGTTLTTNDSYIDTNAKQVGYNRARWDFIYEYMNCFNVEKAEDLWLLIDKVYFPQHNESLLIARKKAELRQQRIDDLLKQSKQYLCQVQHTWVSYGKRRVIESYYEILDCNQ